MKKKMGALVAVPVIVGGAVALAPSPTSASEVTNGCTWQWLSAPSPTAGYVQAQGTSVNKSIRSYCSIRVHAKVGDQDVYTAWQNYDSCCFATQRINARIPYVISWAKVEVAP